MAPVIWPLIDYSIGPFAGPKSQAASSAADAFVFRTDTADLTPPIGEESQQSYMLHSASECRFPAPARLTREALRKAAVFAARTCHLAVFFLLVRLSFASYSSFTSAHLSISSSSSFLRLLSLFFLFSFSSFCLFIIALIFHLRTFLSPLLSMPSWFSFMLLDFVIVSTSVLISLLLFSHALITRFLIHLPFIYFEECTT